MDTDSGIALMMQVKTGDQAAFGLLYGQFNRPVHNFFYGLCGDSSLCKDLTQETYLRVWRYRERYSATGSFLAYILAFARYVWLEHRRNLRRHGRPAIGAMDEFLESLEAGPSGGPAAHATRAELSHSLLDALDGLPEDQRMAFVLQAVQGLNAAESASVMQCAVNTARSRKILAVKKLRAALQNVWIEQRSKESSREVH